MAKQKGDILIRKDNDYVEELTIGTDGQVLMTDSTQDAGWKYNTPNTMTFAASGALETGDTVVLNDNGTVSIVSGDLVSSVSGNSTSGNYVFYWKAKQIPGTNKFVLSYILIGSPSTVGYMKCRICTVAGSDIQFGTEYDMNGGGAISNYSMGMDINSDGTVVVHTWKVSGNILTSAATISGTVITAGTSQQVNSLAGTFAPTFYNHNDVAYQPTQDCWVFGYHYYNGTYILGSRAATLSGTVFTFGTETNHGSGYNGGGIQVVYDSANDKTLFMYCSSADVLYGKVITATGGTSLTYGSGATLSTGCDGAVRATYNSTTSRIIYMFRQPSTNYIYIQSANISGTSVSADNPAEQLGTNLNAATMNVAHDPVNNKNLFLYLDSTAGLGNYKLQYWVVDQDSNGDFTQAPTYVQIYDNAYGGVIFANMYTGNWYFVFYNYDASNFSSGYQEYLIVSNLTDKNFCGFSQVTVSNGEDALIGVAGFVDQNQSGLTAGQNYFVDPIDGSISLSASEAFAGMALNSTDILVKGYDNSVRTLINSNSAFLSGAIDTGISALSAHHETDTFWLSAAIDQNTIDIGLNDADILNLQNDTASISGQVNGGDIWLNTSTFLSGATPLGVAGELYWDDDNSTLSLITGLGNVVQIGQETFGVGKNLTGATVYDGAVVRMTGAQGGVPTFELAHATGPSSSGSGHIGIVTAPINNNASGPVTTFGIVHDLDTSSYNEGDVLYLRTTTLSPTLTGCMTTTSPEYPDHSVWTATVLRQHASEGSIFVNPQHDSHGWFNLLFTHVDSLSAAIDYNHLSNTVVDNGELTAGTFNPNLSNGFIHVLDVGGNITLGAPTNIPSDDTIIMRIVLENAELHNVTIDAHYKFHQMIGFRKSHSTIINVIYKNGSHFRTWLEENPYTWDLVQGATIGTGISNTIHFSSTGSGDKVVFSTTNFGQRLYTSSFSLLQTLGGSNSYNAMSDDDNLIAGLTGTTVITWYWDSGTSTYVSGANTIPSKVAVGGINGNGTLLTTTPTPIDGVCQIYTASSTTSGATWSLTQTLSASDRAQVSSDYFGYDADFSSNGDILVVSDYYWPSVASAQGAVYTFRKNDQTGDWVEIAGPMTSPVPGATGFGWTVQLDSTGTILQVGDIQGRMYIYNWNGSNWALTTNPILFDTVDASTPRYFSMSSDGKTAFMSVNYGISSIYVYRAEEF